MPETEAWEYSLYIPNDIRAVPVCRRLIRLVLTVHGLIHLADLAELLGAELVSNAVRHTKGPAALRVRWRDGTLRVGAWDADPEPPHFPGGFTAVPPTEGEDGRGLCVVRTCSDLWGWQPLSRFGNRGKYVWCELSAA
ncbi:ATP-binding protein [Streptomyces griseosporeus]|uniref:ATP-binding protein n=1 Tax=Streptomyces griseosporeus TaxID=1910 RepID=UPI00167EC3E4|nr:ATP-binding protein [Streptomyces griseosporeus]GHF77811.1 ATPase [Streptomyces griseosporeus]